MMDSEPILTFIIAIIGAVTGLAALVWKMWDCFVSYLQIEVCVDSRCHDYVTVITMVKNRSVMKKKLKNALLLIGPEDENPLKTMHKITELPFCSTNEIAEYHTNEIESGPNGRCLIPIVFYYSENIRIGDEKLSYRVPVDIRSMERGTPYSVRFFIGTPGRFPRRLHRSTQDCFILPKGNDD